VAADVLLQQREHRFDEAVAGEELDEAGVDVGAQSADEIVVVIPGDPLVVAAATCADKLQPR